MATHPEQSSITDVTASQTVRIAPVETVRFDDYVIVGKLGHGGMAEVFLAFEEGPNDFRKLVVIKRLLAHLGEEPEMVRMFLDEARLAARLNHPHVVQTNKIGSTDGRPFMAMEYLDGQPLSKLFRRLGQNDTRLPVGMAARIVSDALDGLVYAHDATDFDGSPLHIVHRDISPQNIFVTYDGAVKILDFGIAKAETQEALTRTGLVKGKLAYIAPEQAQGQRVDRRADVWSMGVVLWEALVGRRLFKAPTEIATLTETLTRRIDAPHEIDPTIPVELSLVAMKALQRDVAERYADAHQMKEELDDWLAASSKSGSRRSLSVLMRETFSDTIEEQRDLIRRCVERVQEVKVLAASAQGRADEATHLELPVTVEDASSVRPSTRPAPTSRRRFVPLIAIALLLVIGGVTALVWPRDVEAPASPDAPRGPVAGAPTELAVMGVSPEPAPGAAVPAPSTAVAPAAAPVVAGAEAELVAAPEADDEGTAPIARRTVRGPRRMPPPSLAVVPEPPARVEPPARPDPTEAPGRLTLDTEPWSVVSLGGRRLGVTPLVNVELPAGTHMLTLTNEELGLRTSYRVTIPQGGVVTRRLVLE